MQEQETSEKLRIIEELKKDGFKMLRLIAEVGLLERKLDLKQRELHQLTSSMLNKQKKASLSEDKKIDLGAFIKQRENQRTAISSSLLSDWAEVESKLKALGVEDAACFYDNPQNLKVTVVRDNQPNVTIDLIKSVKADVRNIGHPIVVEAIRRYLLIPRYSSQTSEHNVFSDAGLRMKPSVAKANLDRLFRAIVAGAETRPRKAERQNFYSFLLTSHKYSLDYFDSLWKFLHDPAVKNSKRSGTKLELIKLRLMESYPDEDHQDVLDYLASVLKDRPEGKLPRRGGGEALRNAFLGWQHKVSPKSAKEYISKGQRWFRELASRLPPDKDYGKLIEFSEEEKKEIVEDFVFAWLGLGHMKPYVNLSKLVKEADSSTPENEDT